MKKEILYERLLDLLFPNDIKCIVCDDELSSYTKYGVCEKCAKNLPFITQKICERCGEPIDDLANYCNRCKNKHVKFFTQARASFSYENEIVSLIHTLKFNYGRYLAEYLSNFLVDVYNKLDWKIDYVVPVPMSKKRFKQRGYNQSLLIATQFCNSLNLTLNATNLVKIKHTLPQTELTGADRYENLINAFMVQDNKLFKDKNILLIDDVYTTGSTMEEISRILLKSGVKNVYCLTVAHTKPPKDLD